MIRRPRGPRGPRDPRGNGQGPNADDDGPWGTHEWSAYLGRELGYPVAVRFSNARSRILIHRPDGRGSKLSMQRFFADAPPAIRRALAIWLRSGKRAPKRALELDEWISARLGELKPAPPRKTTLRPVGRVHDLSALAEELRASEFPKQFPTRDELPGITWGRRAKSRSRYSLQLGVYDHVSRIVRIHPVLDQEAVPTWFVRYVLFHELLHAVIEEPETRGGRRVHHGPQFLAREARYRDTERANAWQEKHVAALIRSARAGTQLRIAAEEPQPSAAQRLVQRLLF